MDRFSIVDDGLCRGGAPSYSDLSKLKDYGVSRVVSLDGQVGNRIKPYCKSLGLQQFIIPLGDGRSKNLPFLKKHIRKLLGDNNKTYVHCYHGKDRTSMICAMYRMTNGWPLSKALDEAKYFQMGEFLSPEVKKSYYDAVKSFSDDVNHSDDIVSMQREQLKIDDLTPGINDQSIPMSNQMSFAPYIDPIGDRLNRPASEKLYRFCMPNEVFQLSTSWYPLKNILPQIKNRFKEKLYSAKISLDADVLNKPTRYSKSLEQAARLDGSDAVIFTDKAIIFNPNALIDIIEENINKQDSQDVADVPEVGTTSNYDGLAPYSFPGSGGIMESGYGGFAGPVQLPFTRI